MHEGQVVAQKGKYKVIDCEVCGFKHLDPVPTHDEIVSYYRNMYYQEDVSKVLIPEKEDRESMWADLGHKDTLEVFNSFVDSGARRLLDVGCGYGYFMRFMTNRGWECVGIEPSPQAERYTSSMGLKVHNTTLEEYASDTGANSFDAINLKYVLEHVPSPHGLLDVGLRLLKPGGMICVEVPNDFSRLQTSVCGNNVEKWWVSTPDHINYFNHDSLCKLLKRHGVEVVSSTTGFPMEMFLLMGDNYVGDNVIGNICHQKRMKFDLSLPDDLRRSLYSNLGKLGVGRSCIVYGKAYR